MKYFLARNQKISGPLTEQEFETIRKSGELSSYTWIFRDGDHAWSPLDPPPALPDSAEIAPAPARPASPLRASLPDERYRIILFDSRNATVGWLRNASASSGEITSELHQTDPLFPLNGAACLSIFDTKTQESVKFPVCIKSCRRANGVWVYEVQWKRAPAILGKASTRLEESQKVG